MPSHEFLSQQIKQIRKAIEEVAAKRRESRLNQGKMQELREVAETTGIPIKHIAPGKKPIIVYPSELSIIKARTEEYTNNKELFS